MSNTTSDGIKSLIIKDLFFIDRYEIPIYQRNYAWGKIEITQLIDDINDYVDKDQAYYIGTLIVYKKIDRNNVVYETIDGQQRLTTLSILMSVLRNEFHIDCPYNEVILSFESRKLSQSAIEMAYFGKFDSSKDYHQSIRDAYNHIVNEIKVKVSDIDKFADYVLNKVTLIRVEVPHDTDLNHYFEIMNNRGEQLEKHEILKSYMIEALQGIDDENEKLAHQELLSIVWDAASDMDRYVQFGFEKKLRSSIFGKSWGSFHCSNYESLYEIFTTNSNNQYSDTTEDHDIDAILKESMSKRVEDTDKETSDRFHSVINFQNFLLHVLKIQTRNIDYALDDKRLLEFFKEELDSNIDKVSFVKEFCFNLLKAKYLLDTFIIKRQYLSTGESWSLLKMQMSNDKGYYINTFGKENNLDNETVIMLLSMFHVSTPTMIYKHWLNASLKYLIEYENVEDVNCDDYISYLETFAKRLLCFNFLEEDKNNRLDYNTLIYGPNSVLIDYPIISPDNKMLTYGNIQNNLLFNLLDYIIWFNDDKGKYDNFEFTFRSSVEHYYPQNPIGGEPLNDLNILHSFGNLCLISHQKNSKLNHHLPSAKKDYYAKIASEGQLSFDSLKQAIMMEQDAFSWSRESIISHNIEMVKLINEFIHKPIKGR